MRIQNLFLSCALLFAAPCFAQSAGLRPDAGFPFDTRPIGKYLVEICTLSDAKEETQPNTGSKQTVTRQGAGSKQAASQPSAGSDAARTVSCKETRPDAGPKRPARGFGAGSKQDAPVIDQTIDQTITVKLVCDPNETAPCDPQYPLVANHDFFVSATSDSGLPVVQGSLTLNATAVGGSNPVRYHANGPGSIIIRATQAGGEPFRAAAPVDLILQVPPDAKKAPTACSVLPSDSPRTSTPLDAATIVSLLGNPLPFALSAQGSNTIAIYSTRWPLRGDETSVLASFQRAIVALVGRTTASLAITPISAKPFTVELKIPHGGALGNLAGRVNGLNYSQFTVQNVGNDQLRVTAPTQPDCETWTSFLTDIRHMAWQLVAQPMSQKLFYLSSSDVVAGFSALASSAPPSSSGSPSSTSSSASSGAPSSAPPATGAPSAPGGATPGSGGSNATISIMQPPGSNIQVSSNTTPCVIAGLAVGNANGCTGSAASAPMSGGAGASPASTPAPQPPLAMASMAVAAGTSEQTPSDLLVFSDANPGDDAQIQERRRVIAQLDLPQPEMIINAWVTQNSSANPQAMGAFTNLVKRIVADYNQQFENVVLRGWKSVNRKSREPGYFNEAFRSYIEDRFISSGSRQEPGTTAQSRSQAFLDNTQAQLVDTIASDEIRDPGICPPGRYCLGYNSLFHPLKPVLTDLLLTIIAAQRPVEVADEAVAYIEAGGVGNAGVEADMLPSLTCDTRVSNESTTKEWRKEVGDRCRAIWTNLDLDFISPKPEHPGCAELDYRGILYSLLYYEHEPRVHLRCFKEEAHRLMEASDGRVYGAGLLRARIADFLYNYKLSQQYPHEFQPYDLTQSADALNSALNPLIDAFNRDLTAYQLFVRADMQYQVHRLNSEHDGRCCVKRLFGLDKPSFFNDGLITVRTISGQPTIVNTTSQSYLNVSTAPQLSAILNSLTASPSSPQSPQGSNMQGSNMGNPAGANLMSLSPLSGTPLGLISSVLANYQTTLAQIGRNLNISATPRSLSTAASAEIAVTLSADESSAPSLYSAGGTTDPVLNTSRVANHDTTTRVRVDSVKLFEVSSLTAILSRSRSRFPLPIPAPDSRSFRLL